MTDAAAPPVSTSGRPRPAVRWLRAKDPDLLVIKRSVRAAVVMPSVFAVAHASFSNPQVALFAALGSFTLLLLVEFTGPLRSRLASYLGLYVAGSCLVVLGTIVSVHKVAAVVAMALVGFVVLFAGVVAPAAATASTAALLTFVLPVSVAQPASAIGPRLLGWTLAAAFSITACLVVWPAPWHDNLRRRLAAAIAAVARLADARARGRTGPEPQADVSTELALLRQQFSGTPYPPTGAASGAVALSKLVGRVEWVAGNTAMIGDEHWTNDAAARSVTHKVVETLRRASSLICDDDAHPIHDPVRIGAVQDSIRELDELIGAELAADVASVTEAESDSSGAGLNNPGSTSVEDGSIAATLDPGFHARALGIATEMVAEAALEAAGAQPVQTRPGLSGPSDQNVFMHRLVSHLSFRSVWFRNALRGAVGLALAVTVIEVTNVQHGFWVVLGTLSVLRSNALGTGATALRAVGGTALGVVAGSLIMVGVADHTVLLWVLLPLVVLLSGVAPAMISFVAGQAAFTLVVIILFNIIEPAGWKVGLTRIEDVAIGCGVSLVVGLLFWPRGATAALGRALSDAFVASSGYLADAVDRLTSTSRHVDTGPGQQASHRAYLLLDDVFRQFFAERGARWCRSKRSPASSPDRTASGSPRTPWPPSRCARPTPGCRRSRPSRWVRPSSGTRMPRAIVGTRTSPTCSPTGAAPSTSPCRTGRCCTTSSGRRSTRCGPSAEWTGCRRRCRCYGRTSSSRTRAKCKKTCSPRPTSS